MADTVQVGQEPKKFSNKAIIIAMVVFVLLVAAAIAFVMLRSPEPEPKSSYNPYQNQVVALEKETPPQDPMQRATYYGQIGQNYELLENWDKALQNYLQAQAILEDNHLTDQYVYYQSIANAYAKMGDKKNAEKYYNKQLDYLEAYLAGHPGDEGTINAIKDVEEQLDKL